MLALAQDLFPYLVAFYLLDAIANVRRGEVFFLSAGRQFKTCRSGLRLVGLLPTTEVYAAMDAPPLHADGKLWVLRGAKNYNPVVVTPEDLEEIPLPATTAILADDRRVRLNQRVIVETPTAAHAVALRTQLANAVDSPARSQGRAAAMAKTLASTREGLSAEAPLVSAVRFLSTALFAALFVVLPAIVFVQGPFVLALPHVLTAIGVLHFAVLGTVAVLLAREGASSGRILATLGPLLPLPPLSAHVLSRTRRGRFPEAEAGVLAAVLLSHESFKAFARRELVRISESQAVASGALRQAWAARERIWTRLLAEENVRASELLTPSAAAAGTASWCPACGTFYRPGFERCAECGISLQATRMIP